MHIKEVPCIAGSQSGSYATSCDEVMLLLRELNVEVTIESVGAGRMFWYYRTFCSTSGFWFLFLSDSKVKVKVNVDLNSASS